jgi:predicted flap endonuclease-1-like 5' DNA nuclease
MSLFACCFWLFLFGVLLGWLLNWLLRSMMRKDPPPSANTGYTSPAPASSATPAQFAATTSSSSTPAQSVAPAPVAAAPRSTGIDVAAAAAVGISVKNENDIIIIEGIGPKIKELFNQNGITTFAQIARMSVPEMSAILDKGGARFKLANPGSWAAQAKLASENRWEELKKLQDSLYAGVELTDDDDTGNKA